MDRISSRLLIFAAVLTLAGCAHMPRGASGIVSRPEALAREARTEAAPGSEPVAQIAPAPPAAAPVQSSTTVLRPAGQTAASLDTTTAAEKAAAAAPSFGGGKLGTTIASLGDATESGFWIKTPLVKSPGKGRVVNPANGRSVNVDLKPLHGSGSGSRVSILVMRGLGAALTDLPEIEVWQN